MNRAKKPPLSTLNDHLICHLCKGYFIDATTIIECLHTFCRSCIVKYLETTKYCPVCDVQVHKSKPLLSLRSDKVVQEIVYKLVPRLFNNELQRRKEFHKKHQNVGDSDDDFRLNYQNILSSDEDLCLRLNYNGATCKPRYFKCPSGVSIMHLQKLLKAKFDLTDLHHIDILYNQNCLNPSYTLMDVVYIYKLSKLEPLDFTYRIYEYMVKKMKVENKVSNKTNNNNNNWKEVQLRISENGEMSIQTSQNFSKEMMEVLDAKPILNNNRDVVSDSKPIKPPPTPPPPVKLKILNDETILPAAATESRAIAATTTVFTTINSTKCSVVPPPSSNNHETELNKTDDGKGVGVKRNAEEKVLSNCHEVKKSKITSNNNDTTTTSTVTVVNLDSKINNEKTKNQPNTPKPSTKYSGSIQPCYMPKISPINVPKPPKPPLKIIKTTSSISSSNSVTTVPSKALTTSPKTKLTPPIGYKTLRDPPKSWNSQISKANVPTNPKCTELKNVRPAKFFKMRNSMPRFLGNPASGVKPMYSVPEKDEQKTVVENREIKKHSIVKIDPKTLKPISEKAPEMSSLSSQSDLKINTSSVSIFNPLKLQSGGAGMGSSSNSPKGSEKKSPKAVSPPGGVKLNLNFTPSNPFIPNRTSQTVSPNQFLGPPGFSSYDPRMMAAYHNLFYGSAMGFPPGPLPYHLAGLADMNQRGKNFDISKMVGGVLQQNSATSTTTSTTTTTTPTIVNNKNTPPSSGSSTGQQSTEIEPQSKISSSLKTVSTVVQRKDTTKNEKSLQNAVEKLTLHRAKEIDKLNKIIENSKNDDVKKTEVKENEKEQNCVKSQEKIVETDVAKKEKIEEKRDDEKVEVEKSKEIKKITILENIELSAVKIGDDKKELTNTSTNNVEKCIKTTSNCTESEKSASVPKKEREQNEKSTEEEKPAKLAET